MNTIPATTLVLTHGRDQPFQIPDIEKRDWEAAVRRGLERVGAPYHATIPVAFAFYGDLWRPDANDTGLEGAAPPSPETLAAATELGAELLAATTPPTGLESAPSWSNFDQLLGVLDARLGVGQFVLQHFLGDLAQYFTQPDLRQKTINRVRDTIQAAGGPVVLLGHSMGTVVSYDLLARQADLPVRAYISFGSVLGYPSTRQHVADPQGHTPFPPGLPRWINVYSIVDFAAAVHNLADIYLPADGRAVRVEDRESAGRGPGLTNPLAGHDPLVYLSSTAMGHALRAILEA